jgi:SAM-dependent methyltransferase
MTLESEYYVNAVGIHVPGRPAVHRDQEYEESGFEVLREMQSRHFWYEGRHRFLMQAMKDELRPRSNSGGPLSAVDLGGGCGGWISYLQKHSQHPFKELALADSSIRALEFAGTVIPPSVGRYQIDLLDLGWKDRWDVAFLLDVIEHLPDDLSAFRQIERALRPGGLLFVTTPALKFFWSYNDEIAHHVRRYAREDLARLAAESGLVLKKASYFMFLLSPLLWLSRLAHPNVKELSPEQIQTLIQKTHRVPPKPVNSALNFIFGLETPLGLRLPFPWGTSILGVFQKKS